MNKRTRMSARYARGFTLMEVVLCTIIVGVGFVAAMELFITCSRQNGDSLRMSSAASLAGSIRELITRKNFVDPIDGYGQFGSGTDEVAVSTYDDIDDFDGKTFSPPIDAVNPNDPQRQPGMSSFSQAISVTPVDAMDFGRALSKTATSYGAVRVTVDVMYAANVGATPKSIYTLAWVECGR